jgi:hypothetical protein
MCIKINSRQTGSRNLMGPKRLPTIWHTYMKLVTKYQISPLHRSGGMLFYLCPCFRPSQDIFRRIFLSNYWWQKSDIWSQPSYRYPISWEAFFDPSDSCFLFSDLVGFYTHLTYMHILHTPTPVERGYNKYFEGVNFHRKWGIWRE